MDKLTEVSVKNGYRAACNHYRKLVYPLFLTLLVLLLTSPVQAKYNGGTGEPNNPYQIADANDMNEIGLYDEDWGAHFILVNDINLAEYTGTQFNIIGSVLYPFTGVFDGNGHTISNFTYTSTGTDYIGIFGYVKAPNSVIKNLMLINPNIDAGTGRYVGSLVGGFADGTILKCGVQGGSIFGNEMVGGLVGYNARDYLLGFSCARTLNSYATATVSGNYEVGGLVGHNGGGFPGAFNCSVGIISNCYATGNVLAIGEPNGFIGGLVGWNDELGSISNCYAAGIVNGNGGGLVGTNFGSCNKCFWDNSVNPSLTGTGGGPVDPNVIGKSTEEMQKESTFTDVGWDFVDETDNGIRNIWRLCNEGAEYPQLNWQFLLGDFVCPDGVETNDLAVLVEQWLLEKLSADVAPNGGDGFVDFLDWAVLANGWQNTTDTDDLAAFVGQWLQFSAYSADIAPTPDGDGVVNLLDFAVLANNWLEGTEP